ncbi:MAG: phosphopyruvate hydratase [bacterium]
MNRICDVRALQVLDSRGNPTVEATVTLDDGSTGTAITASGASTGTHEAYELRDTDDPRYLGKGVYRAVANVRSLIKPAIVGMQAESLWDLAAIDARMRGLDVNPMLRTIGANGVIAVSMATARAIAAYEHVPLFRLWRGAEHRLLLPVPQLNVVNGGKHADGLEIQELMIVPVGAPTFAEAIRWAVEVTAALRSSIKQAGKPTTVGDEGGFAPGYRTVREALQAIRSAIQQAGFRPGSQVAIAIDAAANEFFSREIGKYLLPSEGGEKTTEELVAFWIALCNDFPELISIEDGVHEADWEGSAALQRELGNRVQIVGDDLFVTNPDRFVLGIERRAANTILIKPNQNGTVTGTLEVCEAAKKLCWGRIVSHRSGETEDTFIAHFAVGIGAGQIKTGAPCRTDRIGKYNELLRIESSNTTRYAGWGAFPHVPGLAKRFAP